MVRPAHDACPQTAMLFSLLGKKWIIFIIKTLSQGHESFNDIRRSIGSPSAKILTLRLQELQNEGIVDRVVVTTEPLCIRYRLTPLGLELSKFLCHLSTWWGKHSSCSNK
ncbi:MAG: helix-turn-helix domain-containing protein [Candidatus Gracilibacteria bacterium]